MQPHRVVVPDLQRFANLALQPLAGGQCAQIAVRLVQVQPEEIRGVHIAAQSPRVGLAHKHRPHGAARHAVPAAHLCAGCDQMPVQIRHAHDVKGLGLHGASTAPPWAVLYDAEIVAEPQSCFAGKHFCDHARTALFERVGRRLTPACHKPERRKRMLPPEGDVRIRAEEQHVGADRCLAGDPRDPGGERIRQKELCRLDRQTASAIHPVQFGHLLRHVAGHTVRQERNDHIGKLVTRDKRSHHRTSPDVDRRIGAQPDRQGDDHARCPREVPADPPVQQPRIKAQHRADRRAGQPLNQPHEKGKEQQQADDVKRHAGRQQQYAAGHRRNVHRKHEDQHGEKQNESQQGRPACRPTGGLVRVLIFDQKIQRADAHGAAAGPM